MRVEGLNGAHRISSVAEYSLHPLISLIFFSLFSPHFLVLLLIPHSHLSSLTHPHLSHSFLISFYLLSCSSSFSLSHSLTQVFLTFIFFTHLHPPPRGPIFTCLFFISSLPLPILHFHCLFSPPALSPRDGKKRGGGRVS